MNPIAKAVEPLRQDAIKSAAANAKKLVEKVTAELDAAGWDANKAAPFPNSLRCSRQSYREGQSKYYLFRSLTKRADGNISRSPGSPEPVMISEEGVARFIKQMEDQASASYESYVAKLISKVGEVSAAKLLIEGTWAYSLLEVTKPNGEVENWKTQMIMNISVLGKLFNQWPTRKVG